MHRIMQQERENPEPSSESFSKAQDPARLLCTFPLLEDSHPDILSRRPPWRCPSQGFFGDVRAAVRDVHIGRCPLLGAFVSVVALGSATAAGAREGGCFEWVIFW